MHNSVLNHPKVQRWAVKSTEPCMQPKGKPSDDLIIGSGDLAIGSGDLAIRSGDLDIGSGADANKARMVA